MGMPHKGFVTMMRGKYKPHPKSLLLKEKDLNSRFSAILAVAPSLKRYFPFPFSILEKVPKADETWRGKMSEGQMCFIPVYREVRRLLLYLVN